jgi:hypothetical protein
VVFVFHGHRKSHAAMSMTVTDVSLTAVPGGDENPGPFYQIKFTATNVGSTAIRDFTVLDRRRQSVDRSNIA